MQIVRTKLSRFILLVLGGIGFVVVGIYGYLGYRDSPIGVRRGMGTVGLIAGVSLGIYVLASVVQNGRGILIGKSDALVLRRRGFSFRGRTVHRVSTGLNEMQLEITPVFPPSPDPAVSSGPTLPESTVRIQVYGGDDSISLDIDAAWICDDIQERFDRWQQSI